MKYDFSFVDPIFKPIIDGIEKSIELLNSDCKESVYILRICCQIFVNGIGKIKDVKLENDLGHDIDILKLNKILDEDIYFKLNFIEGEFIKLQSLNYTISKEKAQICLDNTYAFIKWYFNNEKKDEEKDEEIDDDRYKKVVFTNEDLNIFDDYIDIKRLLFLGKKFIECDKNDLEYSPYYSMIYSRKVVEHIVYKIQDKFNIKTNTSLRDKIDGLEALMPKIIYYNIIQLIRPTPNMSVYGYGNSITDEMDSISYLNCAYEVSKWYIDFMKIQKDIKNIK